MSDEVRVMRKASLYLPTSLLNRIRRLARLEDRSQAAVLRQSIEIGTAVKEQERARLEVVP